MRTDFILTLCHLEALYHHICVKVRKKLSESLNSAMRASILLLTGCSSVVGDLTIDSSLDLNTLKEAASSMPLEYDPHLKLRCLDGDEDACRNLLERFSLEVFPGVSQNVTDLVIELEDMRPSLAAARSTLRGVHSLARDWISWDLGSLFRSSPVRGGSLAASIRVMRMRALDEDVDLIDEELAELIGVDHFFDLINANGAGFWKNYVDCAHGQNCMSLLSPTRHIQFSRGVSGIFREFFSICIFRRNFQILCADPIFALKIAHRPPSDVFPLLCSPGGDWRLILPFLPSKNLRASFWEHLAETGRFKSVEDAVETIPLEFDSARKIRCLQGNRADCWFLVVQFSETLTGVSILKEDIQIELSILDLFNQAITSVNTPRMRDLLRVLSADEISTILHASGIAESPAATSAEDVPRRRRSRHSVKTGPSEGLIDGERSKVPEVLWVVFDKMRSRNGRKKQKFWVDLYKSETASEIVESFQKGFSNSNDKKLKRAIMRICKSRSIMKLLPIIESLQILCQLNTSNADRLLSFFNSVERDEIVASMNQSNRQVQQVIRNIFVKKLRHKFVRPTPYRNDDCVVCAQPIGLRLAVNPCGHEYHPHCLRKWMLINNSCPNCRATLPKPTDADQEFAEPPEA